MIQFKKMIELARSGTAIYFEEQKKLVPMRSSKHFFSLAEKSQPFVFESFPLTLEQKIEVQLIPAKNEIESCPFPIFSIEMLDSEKRISDLEDLDFLHLGHSLSTLCILCYESGPNEYQSYALCEIEKNQTKHYVIFSGNHFNNIVESFLNRMSENRIGSEKIRERVKIGIGQNKKTVTYSNLIHIRASKKTYSNNPESHRTIDWAYRFTVRGHWREIKNRIGKDRLGNPIKDFTWIESYVKGPESLPIAEKIRLIRK